MGRQGSFSHLPLFCHAVVVKLRKFRNMLTCFLLYQSLTRIMDLSLASCFRVRVYHETTECHLAVSPAIPPFQKRECEQMCCFTSTHSPIYRYQSCHSLLFTVLWGPALAMAITRIRLHGMQELSGRLSNASIPLTY